MSKKLGWKIVGRLKAVGDKWVGGCKIGVMDIKNMRE